MIQNNFKIVIPAYNVEKWISKNIEVILNQTYKNYQCVIIDDASSDKTSEICINQLKHSITEDKGRFKYFKRTINTGALENIVFGIDTIAKDSYDIILPVDGDDRLASNNVFEILNQEYQNPNIFMTYGSYKNLSDGSRGLCGSLPCDVKNYRKSGIWCTSHLRTFRRFLWDKIDKKDLKNEFGRYYSMAWDVALIVPMLEMSGNNRVKYINEILYEYNNCSELNDHRKNVSLQLSTAKEIRNKPVYNLL